MEFKAVVEPKKFHEKLPHLYYSSPKSTIASEWKAVEVGNLLRGTLNNISFSHPDSEPKRKISRGLRKISNKVSPYSFIEVCLEGRPV